MHHLRENRLLEAKVLTQKRNLARRTVGVTDNGSWMGFLKRKRDISGKTGAIWVESGLE